jgi:hypothetical protein
MMKSKVVVPPPVASSNLFQSGDQKMYARQSSTISEFHKFHAQLSTRLSQLGLAIKSFVQDGFQTGLWCEQNREWLQLFFERDTAKMVMNFSITSYK